MDALEERTGVSKRTISEIERGMRTPQTLTLAKLANALSVDLDELLEEDSPKAQAPLPLEDAVQRGAAEPEEGGRYTEIEACGQVLASNWEVELAGWDEKIPASSLIGGATELRFLQWVVDVFVTVGIFLDVAHHHGPPRQELADTLQMMKDVRDAASRKALTLRKRHKTDKQFRKIWEENDLDAHIREVESR